MIAFAVSIPVTAFPLDTTGVTAALYGTDGVTVIQTLALALSSSNWEGSVTLSPTPANSSSPYFVGVIAATGHGAVTIVNPSTVYGYLVNGAWYSVLPQPAPPPAGQTTGYLYTQRPGAVIAYQMTDPPGGLGGQFSGQLYCSPSDPVSGYWSANFYQGAQYTIQVGDNGPGQAFTAPTSDTLFAIANLIGPL